MKDALVVLSDHAFMGRTKNLNVIVLLLKFYFEVQFVSNLPQYLGIIICDFSYAQTTDMSLPSGILSSCRYIYI